MLPSNNSKFNKSKGKAKYFPIKQFRFDVSQHPVIKTKEKCSFRIKTILSQQEETMLTALAKSLNVQSKYAIRIALSKVSTTSSDEVEKSIPYIVSDSKLRGHTSRDRHLAIQLTKREKEAFKTIANTNKLTDKETFRLLIVHTQKGIRSGLITEFINCKMLSQGECWDNWSKDKPVSSGRIDSLKRARDEAYKKASEEGIKRDAERYAERGFKIDQLLAEGSYIKRFEDDKIDVNYLDSCIAADNVELDRFSWELYLEELQKSDIDEREILIEHEIFLAMRLGIDLTRQEAIEIIDEKKSDESISEDEIEMIMQEMEDEFAYMHNIDLERELSKRLGHPISHLGFALVLEKKDELKLILNAEKQFEIQQQLNQKKLYRTKNKLDSTKQSIERLKKQIEELKLIPDSEYKETSQNINGIYIGGAAKQKKIDELRRFINTFESDIEEYLKIISDLKG